MQHLKLLRVNVVTPRHAHVTQYELRRKRQIESDENDQRREASPAFRVHASTDLRPPVMQPTKIGEQRTAHHDVVKVRHDEIRVAQMHFACHPSKKQSPPSP